MRCLDVTVLERHAAGQLPDTEARGAAAHLEVCAACRRTRHLLTQIDVDGSTVGSPPPPPAAWPAPTQPMRKPVAIAVESADAHLEVVDADADADDADATTAAAGSSGARRLGRYLLLSTLGAGGMGVVHEAYDPDLDRRVALKLLRGRDEEGRARFLREAQAMARLDHPNVITVYDVGIAGGVAYIAMELVAGGTLRPWMEGARRPWREVVARFAAAGRGLAAAHAAGIIHRDFKPDNVLLGRDGAIRVTDFGLATAGASLTVTPAEVAGPSAGLLDASLTQTGVVLGTPAYMAPEQYAGSIVDERSDQFAFCVALFEALYGARPFAGDTPRALATAVGTGAIRTLDGDAPCWLRKVVVRGLAVDPGQRWPSMGALLEALDADPARRRRRAAAAVAVVAVTVGCLGAAWHAGTEARDQPCLPDGAAFADIWDPGERERVRAAFAATGASFASDAFARVATELDGRTAAWTGAVRAACEDTRVRRTASEATLERRMACLASRRDELRALVAQLHQADTSTMAEASNAAARLTSVDTCADLGRLLEAEPAPADPRLADVRRALADATAAQSLGLADKAATIARAALPIADEVGWQTVRGELALVIGQSARRADRRTEARAALDAAVWASDAAHDDQTRARAWMELAELEVADPDPAASTRALDQAAAVVRRRAEPALSTALDLTRARVLSRRGAVEDALGVVERAHGWLVANRGAEHPDTLAAELEIASLNGDLGHSDQVIAQLTRLIEALRRAYGPAHPSLAAAYRARGVAAGKILQGATAEPDFAAALAIQRAAYGDRTGPVSDLLSDLGSARLDRGDAAAAREAFGQALVIRRTLYGADSVEVARLVGRLGAALRVAGEPVAAADHLRRARETIVRLFGEHHADLPYLAAEEIEVLLALGRSAEARDRARWYVAITERSTGADSFFVAVARAGAAHVILETRGDPAEAARLIEISWKHLSGQAAIHVAPQYYNLARARWRMGDHTKARALMTEALHRYIEAGPDFAGDRAEVEAWLRRPR